MIRRERVWNCVHPDTFKYYLDRDDVIATWRRLAARYGAPSAPSSFGVVEIHTERLWIRAPRFLNPITVVRRRQSTSADVEELHALLGFVETTQSHANAA